jgi:hypothetical protein
VTEPPKATDDGSGALPARIRPFLGTPSVSGQPGGDSGSDPDPPARPPGLRPFVLTSGRVRGDDPDIGLETQVSARPRASLAGLPRLASELQAIVALCGEPISVAEISARLRLHLGVTKILVGDLRAAGYLDVHLVDVASTHDPDTILRVMRGLRAIS